MTTNLSIDSQVILLLASNIGLSPEKDVDLRPLSFSEWNSLSEKLAHSSLQRPSALFKEDSREWKEQLELTDAQVERLQRLLARGAYLSMEIERLRGLGIWITTRVEPTYPQRLKKILKRKSPIVLFGAGDHQLASVGGVAIVGSREIDPNGGQFTAKLAKKCAGEDLVVISGGARGVDSIAQDMALNNGGQSVSVLANGLEQVIRRREVRDFILGHKLLLLSPFHPKVPFHAFNAMDRNKYVYALSDFVVVIAVTENKGGTWAGAIENLKANWVPLFVRADDPCSSGNKSLINQGAVPIDLSTLSNDRNLREWLIQKTTQTSQQRDTSYRKPSNTINPRTGAAFSGSPSYSISELSERVTNLDLFSVILPYLKKALNIERDTNELSEILHVEVSQLKIWLERATKEGYILLLDVNGKYISNFEQDSNVMIHEQLTIF